MDIRLSNIATTLVLVVLSALNVQAASPAATSSPGDKAAPAADKLAAETAQVTGAGTGTSVLERFQAYSGPRTPAGLSALFADPVSANLRQLPEVALSDGATTVIIESAFAPPNASAPNVACTGARLISIKLNDAGKWVIWALPAKGSWKASLIMLTDSARLEVPLVVAPVLPAGTDLSEKGFITFLGNKAPKSQPLKDLNGDGQRDYLDDYIFTANYLVSQRSGAAVPDTGPSAGSQEPGSIQNPDVQDKSPQPDTEVLVPGADLNPDAQGLDPKQRSAPQEPGSGQSPPAQGPYTGPSAAPPAPLSGAPAGATAATVPNPPPEIRLDTSPDRHNLTNRNERARKMKELLNPPAPVQ